MPKSHNTEVVPKNGVDACLANGHPPEFCHSTCKNVNLNQIVNGQELDLLKCLGNGSVDTIVTTKALADTKSSPPEWYTELYRILRNGGLIFAFAPNDTYSEMAIALERAGFTPRDVISWLYWSEDPDATHLKPAHIPIFMGLKQEKGSHFQNIIFNINDVRIPYRNEADKKIAQYGADGFAKRLKQPQEKYLATGWGMRRIHDYKINQTGRYPTNVLTEESNDAYMQSKFADINVEAQYLNEPDSSLAKLQQNNFFKKSTYETARKSLYQGKEHQIDRSASTKGYFPHNIVTATDLEKTHPRERKEDEYIHEPRYTIAEAEAGAKRRVKSQNKRGAKGTFLVGMDTMSQDVDLKGVHPRNVITDHDLLATESNYLSEPAQFPTGFSRENRRSNLYGGGKGINHKGRFIPNTTGRYPANTVTLRDLAEIETLFLNEPLDIPEQQVSHQSGFPMDQGKIISTRPFAPNPDGRYPQNVVTLNDLESLQKEDQHIKEPKDLHSQHHTRKYVRKVNSTFFKDGMEDKHTAHPLGRHPANTVTEHDLITIEAQHLNEPKAKPPDSTKINTKGKGHNDLGILKDGTRITDRVPYKQNDVGRFPANTITLYDLNTLEPTYIHQPLGLTEHAWTAHRKPVDNGYRSTRMTNRIGVDKANPIGRYPSNTVTQQTLRQMGQVDPLKMVEWILKLATKTGDVVLDPATQSMDVVNAARHLGRSFLAFNSNNRKE